MEDGSNMDGFNAVPSKRLSDFGGQTASRSKRSCSGDAASRRDEREDFLNSISQNGGVSKGRKLELAEHKDELSKLKKEYLAATDEYLKDIIKKEIGCVQEAIGCLQKAIGCLQKGRERELKQELDEAIDNYKAEKDDAFLKDLYKGQISRIKKSLEEYSNEQIFVSQERISIYHEMKEDDQKERENQLVELIPFSEDDSEFCEKLVDADPFSPSFKPGENINGGLLKELKSYFSKEVSQEHVNECQKKYFSPSCMQTHVRGCGENVEVSDLHPYIIFLTKALMSFCANVGFGYDVTDNAILDALSKDDKSAIQVKRVHKSEKIREKDANEKDIALRPDVSILAGPFPIFRAELKASDKSAETKNAEDALRNKSGFLVPTHDRAPFVLGIVQCAGKGYVCAIYPDSTDENKIVLIPIKHYNIRESRVLLLTIFIQIARVGRWLIQWAPTRLISSIETVKTKVEGQNRFRPCATLRSSIRTDNLKEYTTIDGNSATKVVASRTDVMKTLYDKLIAKRGQSTYPDSLICPKEFKEELMELTKSSEKLVNVTFDSLYYQPRFPINTHECVRVIVDILAALLYLHKLGYVHRDLRRNNILRQKVPDDTFILIDLEHADLVGEVFPYDEVHTEKYCFPERIRDAKAMRMGKGEKTPSTAEGWQKLDDIAQFGEYIHEAVEEMKKEEDKENARTFAKYLKEEMSQDEYNELEGMSEGENVKAKLELHVNSKLKKTHTEAPTGG